MPNMQPNKTPMPEQDPHVRNKNFKEVALGYTDEMAINEAQRCLQCKNPACVQGCPVNVPIKDFIHEIVEGNMDKAYEVIKSQNSLPAVCGRVCPQETQCESKCVRGIKNEPVAIGRLERYVADWYMNNREPAVTAPKHNGHKVAVLGSGPSGLTCAGDLAKLGYEVTVFEALHAAGGVLMYGIPEFRLPKKIVQEEIQQLEKMGVKIDTDMVMGKVLSVDELFEMGYEALYIGTGAGLPNFMNLPGEGLVGVYSANEFLTRINLMKAYLPEYDTPIIHPKNVAVVGGGNVAMDAARCAKRLGAENVYIIYRRSEEEMPARNEEIHHAKEEEIIFKLLNNPVAIHGDEQGKVKQIECVEMELGEPDASGRRSPVPTGETVELPCDLVISAVGEQVEEQVFTDNGITLSAKGRPAFCTNVPGVYAAGDALRGPATVVEGIADAARFAEAVIGAPHTYDIPAEAHPTEAEAIARKGILRAPGKACCEGERCLSCDTVCQNCVDVCPNRANVAVRLPDGRTEIVHVDKMCNECGNCTQFCPYHSEPCHDKFTLFQTAEDMADSHNTGVLFLGGDRVKVRTFGEPKEYDLSGRNDLPAELEKLIVTVRDRYAYLFA